jgi:putative ABC transport system permease protein
MVTSTKPEDSGRRTRVAKYGLTLEDWQRMEATIPGLEAAVPMRIFPAELRRVGGATTVLSRVVATTPDFARVFKVDKWLARPEHRFLCESDDQNIAKVVVLGPAVARALFPNEDPVGRAVQVGEFAWRVVGVLGDRPVGATPLEELDAYNLYLPLTSARRLLGATIPFRTAGSWRAEQVEVHRVALTMPELRQVPAAIQIVVSQLAHFHENMDWAVQPKLGYPQ